MLEKLKKLGVGPGKFDSTKLDPALLKGINRAPAEVCLKFQAGRDQAPTVNGWKNPLNLGDTAPTTTRACSSLGFVSARPRRTTRFIPARSSMATATCLLVSAIGKAAVI